MYFVFYENIETYFVNKKEEIMKEEKIAKIKVNDDIVIHGIRRLCKGEVLDLFITKNSSKVILRDTNPPYTSDLSIEHKIIVQAILDKRIEYHYKDVQVEYCEELSKNNKAYELFEYSVDNGANWKDCLGHPSWINIFIYRKKKPEVKKLTMAKLMSGLLSGKVYVNNSEQYIKLDNEEGVVNVYYNKDCKFISIHNSPLKTFIPENWTLVK